MQSTQKQIVRILIIFGLLLLFHPKYLQAMEDAIIAVVEGEPITLKDLDAYLNTIYLQLTAQGRNPKEVKAIMERLEQEGLEQLVEQKLLVIEADKKEMEIRKGAVDEQVEDIRKKYPSEQVFLDELVKEGLTITDLRKKIENQLKAKYIVDLEVQQEISVTPQEVTQYYQEHMNEFKKDERVDLDSILIDSKGDPKAAKEKANQAFERLKTEDFASVAQEFSKSPSIGIVEKGQLIPALEQIVFNLKVGEMSSPFEMENGIYIFKVKAKLPAEITSIEEVKDTISNLLYEQKFKEKFTSWIEKLKDQAYIEIKE